MPKNNSSHFKLLETISVILLSAATVLTSWCAFQSNQWSGEQYFRIDDETAANQFRLQKEVAATQRQTAHLQMFLEYTSAWTKDDTVFADFLYDRFPPELKTAIIAWQKANADHDPDNPESPFEMDEYYLPEKVEALKYAEKAAAFKKAANESDQYSDNYLMLSVILSMVLFFCGISGITNSAKNKKILLGTALLIFLIASFFAVTLPILF